MIFAAFGVETIVIKIFLKINRRLCGILNIWTNRKLTLHGKVVAENDHVTNDFLFHLEQ